MGCSSYRELAEHIGHQIEVAIYGKSVNAAIECMTCHTVLVDFDNDWGSTHRAIEKARLAIEAAIKRSDAFDAAAIKIDLSTHVANLKRDESESINKAGVLSQAHYIIDTLGVEDGLGKILGLIPNQRAHRDRRRRKKK